MNTDQLARIQYRATLIAGTLAILLLSLRSCAQSGWGLKGGVVYMPLEDLQLIHAKRKVADAMLSERARAVGLMASRVEGLKVANGLLEAENQRSRDEVAKAWEAAALCKDDLDASERNVGRLRPWATIGKVTVAVSAVAVVVAGVGIIKDALEP